MPIVITRKSKVNQNIVTEPLVYEETPVAALAVEVPTPTLEAVITKIRSANTLSKSQKSELISACKTTATISSQSPKDVLATAPVLRAIFAKTNFAAARLSKKRYDNVRSGVGHACKLAGVFPSEHDMLPLTQDWEAFLEKSTKNYHAWTLHRLAKFCCQAEVDPASVTDATLSEFEAYLDARIIVRSPAKIRRSIAIAFNRICKDNGLTAYKRLTPILTHSYVSPPLESYPASIQNDVEAFLEQSTVTDRFEDLSKVGFYKPISIRNIRNQLRQFLDAAVLGGFPKSSLTDLSVLIDKPVWSPAFEQIRNRIGKNYPTTLTNIMRMLVVIAKYHVRAPDDKINILRAASRHIAIKNGLALREMGDRSKEIMKQFEHPENIAAVINLPEVLLKGAAGRRRTYDGAMDAMVAAAIATLLNVPMRMQNLASLTFGKNLTHMPMKAGQCIYKIHIAALETKNLVQIEAEVIGDEAEVISDYVKRYRSRLCDKPTEALFPGIDGGTRDPGKLGMLISDRIEKHTGLEMTPHCFRHLAAKIFLDGQPGDYEGVRRVLGHRTVKTTINFYSPRETTAAQHQYHKSLAALKKGK